MLSQDTQSVQVQLPSGGILMVEPVNLNRVRVVSLVSTDPNDYLDARFQPGNIIDIPLSQKIRA